MFRFVVAIIVLWWAKCRAFIPSVKYPLRKTSTHLMMTSVVDPFVSLACGSLAGVVGIGAAYPLDSLKTKAQVYAASNSDSGEMGKFSLPDLARVVYSREGVGGFYQGVVGVMVGEAFVKATLFGANAWALSVLCPSLQDATPSLLQLTLAAAFSGVVSSFVLNPIERVKVLMQADASYTSEWDCISQVVKKDGVAGLLVRGLSGMLAREIPGCVVYFVLYTLLRTSALPSLIGAGPASFLSGAAAGVGAWIPIYPADVVKTAMQNTQGGARATTPGIGGDGIKSEAIEGESAGATGFWATAVELYSKCGPSVFFVGIQPKLLRAGLNHAVTFATYNQLLQLFNTDT